jgi:uncharacterized protein YukE
MFAPLPVWELEAAAAAAELRSAADLLEDHAARRLRMAQRWLPAWTGRHRDAFDAEVRQATATTRELAAALRAAAARIDTNLRQ